MNQQVLDKPHARFGARVARNVVSHLSFHPHPHHAHVIDPLCAECGRPATSTLPLLGTRLCTDCWMAHTEK